VSEERESGFARFPLEYITLGLLWRHDQHGYDLYRAFERDFGLIWKAGRSKFYATLDRLETAHYLESTLQPQEDHPPRRVYHLTAAGRAAFEEWVRQPVRPIRAVRVELLAKLHFYALLGLSGVDTLIDTQAALCREEIARWERLQMAHHEPFDALVYTFRIRQAMFIIEWLQTCRGVC